MVLYGAYFGFFGFVLIFLLIFVSTMIIRRRRAIQNDEENLDNDLQNPYDLCPVHYPTPPIPPQVFDSQQPLYQPPTATYTSETASDINEITTPPSPASPYDHVDLANPVSEPAPPTYEETITRPVDRETSNNITTTN